MIYLADTANINEIKDLLTHFPIEGVTSNPTILANENKPLTVIIPEIQECIGNKMFHIQTISTKAEDILREARRYRDHFGFGDNLYVKIPVTKEGFRAIRLVKDAGMNVTATAVFTQQQALIAAKAGADFVAPYINRLDNISSHGIDVVSDIVKSFKTYGIQSKVLGASFKNVDQVYRVSMVGCHAATVSYQVLEVILKHPMTDKSVVDFENDGAHLYDLAF